MLNGIISYLSMGTSVVNGSAITLDPKYIYNYSIDSMYQTISLSGEYVIERCMLLDDHP